MIQGRCPICSKAFRLGAIEELPSFPFCSERCRLVDLGRWADGRYVFPGEAVEQPTDPKSDGASLDEEPPGAAP
jgi:endogenous inhibitor of DNA gyrase (YacG/DUF329 family)